MAGFGSACNSPPWARALEAGLRWPSQQGRMGRPDQTGLGGGNHIYRHCGQGVAHGAFFNDAPMKRAGDEIRTEPRHNAPGQVEATVGTVGQQEIAADRTEQGAERVQRKYA